MVILHRECMSCGQQMVGIKTYNIREECEECGGKPLINYGAIEQPKRVRK